jgi:hypothetical protein
MIESRPTEVTITIGSILVIDNKEWLVEGFNPDDSIIITKNGRWKTIGVKSDKP